MKTSNKITMKKYGTREFEIYAEISLLPIGDRRLVMGERVGGGGGGVKRSLI